MLTRKDINDYKKAMINIGCAIMSSDDIIVPDLEDLANYVTDLFVDCHLHYSIKEEDK